MATTLKKLCFFIADIFERGRDGKNTLKKSCFEISIFQKSGGAKKNKDKRIVEITKAQSSLLVKEYT